MKRPKPPIQALLGLRGEIGLSLSDFFAHLSNLVPLFVKKQVRYKVVDIPGPRTIRFYHHRGLIDPAFHSGKHATYTYRHILQTLVVKFLQTENLTLKKIAEVTRTSRNETLEDILINGQRSFSLVPHSASLVPLSPSVPPYSEQVRDYPRPAGESFWRRYDVAAGLELNVAESFNPVGQFDVLSQRILEILATMSYDGAGSREQTQADCLPAERGSTGVARIRSRSGAVIALVTEGGLVPTGNPDRLESARARRFLKYHIAGMSELPAGEFESIDKGWDNQYVNENPNRLLPVDVMAELQKKETIPGIYQYFYTTTGVGTTLEESQILGQHVAAELRTQQISAVILTST